MRELIELAFAIQAQQLVDSTLPTTREFWRRKLGFPEHIVTDPRPLRDIIDKAEGT